MPVFPIDHLPVFAEENMIVYQEYLSNADPHVSFVGLEPFGNTYRSMRFSAFAADVKIRYGLMLDTGAPETCCGIDWLTRYIADMGITTETWQPYQASLSGIGSGSATVNWKVSCPIGVEGYVPTLLTAQVLEGIGKRVPCLFGLHPMTALNAVIDLRDQTITLDTPNGARKRLKCHSASGHMLLPIDWNGHVVPTSKEKFIADPLGLALWFCEPEDTLIASQPGPEDLPCFNFVAESPAELWWTDTPMPCFPCLVPSDTVQDILTMPLPPGLEPSSIPTTGENNSAVEKLPLFAKTLH